jgi:hypothetical protein
VEVCWVVGRVMGVDGRLCSAGRQSHGAKVVVVPTGEGAVPGSRNWTLLRIAVAVDFWARDTVTVTEASRVTSVLTSETP